MRLSQVRRAKGSGVSMQSRLLLALKNLLRLRVPSGKGDGPDEIEGGAGVRSPLKPVPVLVGSDAKPIPKEEDVTP